jgi:hypothetical protein
MRRDIFLFFLVLYLATTAGHIYTIDGYLNYAVTKSIGSYHKLSMPRSMMTVEGRGGRYYSKLGIGQSLADLPMYYLGGLVETLAPGEKVFKAYSDYVYIPLRTEEGTRLVKSEPQTLVRISELDGGWVFFTTLTNAFVCAAACLVFFLLLASFGVTPRRSFLGALVLGFATPLWVYSRDLFGDPLFTLSLLGAFYLIARPDAALTRRRAALAGLFSSLGILTRVSFAPLAAIFAVYVIVSLRRRGCGAGAAASYVAASLPGLIAVAVLNRVRFESVFMSGYHTAFDKGFSVPLFTGLAYNLVSPYRSIFLYAPPVLLFFIGAAYFAAKRKGRLALIAAVVAFMFILYSRWWAWHGGWCWGPRFYLPVMPLLMLPGLVYVMSGEKRRLRALVFVLAAAGFLVQVGAVLINYTTVYDYWIKAGKLDWAEAGIQSFSPITTHWQGVFTTSPAQYDLWLIQSVREAGPAFIAVGAALAALAVWLGMRLRSELAKP